MKKLIRFVKDKKKLICEKHLVSRISMIKDYIFAAFKIIFGMFVQSYFFTVSGLYSICAGLSKHAFFDGKATNEALEGNGVEIEINEYKHLAKMAFFILVGSVGYVVYMARLFFASSNFNYGEIPAITIAAVSFTELTLSIINLKKAKGVLNAGLRCANLTSAFTAMVLTQVAILSFAHSADSSFYNALSGTIFGGLCVATAIIMFIHYFVYKRKTALKADDAPKEKETHAEQEQEN